MDQLELPAELRPIANAGRLLRLLVESVADSTEQEQARRALCLIGESACALVMLSRAVSETLDDATADAVGKLGRQKMLAAADGLTKLLQEPWADGEIGANDDQV
ncbi:MAG: hypothetical protein KKB50_21020 [Planctomycetes bacterium]|nr:hypothetical protein [Planctomycetota bacterium]